MRRNVESRLATDTPLIKDIIADIKKGEVKIPQFQRKFIWKDSQAFDLIDSVASNYPIGSVLFWRTHDKLAVERNIGEFRLPQTDDLSPTDYVLDGQQRLTVIYASMGAPEEEEGFAAAYNVAEDTFVQKPEKYDALIFPLRWIFDTTKILNFRTGLQTFPEKDEYQERLDSIINAFTNYRIPIVTLKELSIEEVCPIFERINSSGTKLSTYDLMVAATWSQEFDLNEEVDGIAESLTDKGFDEIEQNTILKCLSAVKFGGIKKQQILDLRDLSKGEMNDLVEVVSQALLRAVDLLSTDFKIYSWDFLPYEAFVVILCYIFSKINNLTNNQVKSLRRWFWRAAFSERYRVGGENFVSNDLKTIHSYVVKEEDEGEDLGSLPSKSQLIRSIFRSNNSRSRAFIISLALKNPRNITNGAVIDTSEALSHYNKKEFHHIYPRSYLKNINDPNEANSLINICMLASSENKAISDENPNKYLTECIAKLGHDVNSVFDSNLLPAPDRFDYTKSDYASFLEERADLIVNHISGLCTGNIA